jgi:hypothetical protein
MLRIVIRQAEGNLKAGWIVAVRFSIFAGQSDASPEPEAFRWPES